MPLLLSLPTYHSHRELGRFKKPEGACHNTCLALPKHIHIGDAATDGSVVPWLAPLPRSNMALGFMAFCSPVDPLPRHSLDCGGGGGLQNRNYCFVDAEIPLCSVHLTLLKTSGSHLQKKPW